MNKGKAHSEVSVLLVEPVPEPEIVAPLDTLTVKIQSLRVMDENPKRFSIKVTFYDQLILAAVIQSIEARAVVEKKTVLRGSMTYDPSDYEKMNLMVDHPLCVQIQPLKPMDSNLIITEQSSEESQAEITNRSSSSTSKHFEDVSCCNVDIVSLFIDQTKKEVKKRMEPFIKPPLRFRKSWDNLPILSMKLKVTRNKENERHHKVLEQANFMQMTLVAAYNMLAPYDDYYVYTAASKMPVQNDSDLGLVIFSQGFKVPKQFDDFCFNPKWESLRVGDENFVEGDVKNECSKTDIQNYDYVDLNRYMSKTSHKIVWGSFHRTLVLANADQFIATYIHEYLWPIEVHIYGDTKGYSFMGFMRLFNLLYPGENRIRLAVPLQWINADAMQQQCGCELLLTPNEKASSEQAASQRMPKPDVLGAEISFDAESLLRTTGCDDNNAYVIVEIKFARPLKNSVIPPVISSGEIDAMLRELETEGEDKRECTGRGQLDRDWLSTVRSAAASLRRVPYYGSAEFCSFNRQLSETRTRVELISSCWQDAAIYVNNNFVVGDFLRSDAFEEMLMMAHACLIRTACTTLVGEQDERKTHGTLRAARHARQLQDIPHATNLYLQRVVEQPRDGKDWRELSTCLKDVDRDWASVCINKSVVLDPRHPLTLISKGSMLIEENPALAEPFFVALLAFYPFWSVAWTIASAYYIDQELFYMAEQIMYYKKKTRTEGMAEELDFPRAWNFELGDWWDHALILPGMSPYYDAADLLLRLRAVNLAETCLSLAVCDTGESVVYCYFVSLCCRLRGNYEEALCHINTGIQKYGEISYLRTLGAECYHKQKNLDAVTAAFEKAGSCHGAYSTLLSMPCRDRQQARAALLDLVRRQPSAYAWIALADDWMMRAATSESSEGGDMINPAAAKNCAVACAVEALNWDRRAGRAWDLLSKLVKPSARRLHCREMAIICGHTFSEETQETVDTKVESKQSLCHRLGKALRECRCQLCEKLQF